MNQITALTNRFQTTHPVIQMLIVAIAVTAAAHAAVFMQTGTIGWLSSYWGVPAYGGW